MRSTPRAHISPRISTAYCPDPQFKKEGYTAVKKIEAAENQFLAVYARIRGEAAENGVGYALVTPLTMMTNPTEFYERAGSQDIDALPTFSLILGVILVTGLGWMWNYIEGQRPVSRLYENVQALEKSDPKDQLNIYRFRRKMRKLAACHQLDGRLQDERCHRKPSAPGDLEEH